MMRRLIGELLLLTAAHVERLAVRVGDVSIAADYVKHHDVEATELAYMHIGRDLIEQFLIALDKVEDHDVYRDRLTTALGFYLDEIAIREEHV